MNIGPGTTDDIPDYPEDEDNMFGEEEDQIDPILDEFKDDSEEEDL
jgi:hypothetical protein